MPDLHVFLKRIITGSDSVIVSVMSLSGVRMSYSVSKQVFASALLGAIGLLVGCDMLSMDVEPSADEIQSFHAEWLVNHSNLVGINRNLDVDSILFQYESTSDDSVSFWNQIHENASSSDWELIEDLGETRRYQKIIPRTGEIVFHSVEETRINYKNGDVVVAWLQTDHSGSEPPESVNANTEGRDGPNQTCGRDSKIC